jgi:NADH dehydrogenase [ubiquinone] 1 alpha subcomplex assembly factor 1
MTPLVLAEFRDRESVAACKVLSDQDIGGFSTCKLEWQAFEATPSTTVASATPERSQEDRLLGRRKGGYARFSGTISTELPKDRPNVHRTGFAAFRTPDRRRTLFTKGLWDIDPYAYLALRIKSDGRSYFVNVQTESVEPTDIHQHRLFAKRPGEWETVLINWNEFVRTNHGHVVEPQSEMLRQRVGSIGIGLTDRVPGPFEICVERIWACNGDKEAVKVGGMEKLKAKLGAAAKGAQAQGS